MARMSESERLEKQSKARKLYLQGFDFVFISEVVKVGRDTLSGWATEGNWSDVRDSLNLGVDEINELIFKTLNDIKEGKKPIASPDAIAKLVAAYEKLNDKQKYLRYGLHAFDELSSKVLLMIKNEKQKAKRESYLTFFRRFRTEMDTLIEEWTL